MITEKIKNIFQGETPSLPCWIFYPQIAVHCLKQFKCCVNISDIIMVFQMRTACFMTKNKI